VKVKAVLFSLGQYLNLSLPSSAASGMTETSPGISHMDKKSEKHESVGGPIFNTRMKVVNTEKRSSLAARETGEICVRDPQVRARAFRFCCFPYLVLLLLFYVTNVFALPVGSLTVLISPTLPTDRPCG